MTVIVATATLAACGDDDGTDPAPTIAIALSSATLSVQQGANATATVALTRARGFTGDVAIAVQGLPTGVTVAPVTIGASSTSGVLAFTASTTAAPATTTVTVRATGTGVSAKTATLALTVTAAPAQSYTIAIAPATTSIAQGTNGNVAVSLTRTGGFAGVVGLAVTGLPTGVTAALNPQSIPGTSSTSTITLTAAANAAVGGPTTVTVTSTATGQTAKTATFQLNVTAAPAAGNTTWEFCTAGDTPIWLAVQDGDGAWTRVTPAGTTFRFNITSARGGVAFVTGATSATIASASQALVDGFALSIFYGTRAELNSQGTQRCLPGTGKTVNGSVANVDVGQMATVTLGPASATIVGGTGATLQLTKVPDGALDLIASRSTTNPTTLASLVDKVIIRRGLNQANGSTIPVLDFDAAEAFAPATANITVGNLNGEVAAVSTRYFTSSGSGTSGAGLASATVPRAGPYAYYGVPVAKQAAGDLHLVQATAYPSSQDLTRSRSSALFFKNPTDHTVTLGPALTLPTVTPAATAPYVRFGATGPVQTQYNKAVVAVFTQTTTQFHQVLISASEGYLAGSFTYDLTVPDFSGVSGWDNNWGPTAGTITQWIVSASGYTGPGVGRPTPVEGVTFFSAARSGSITIFTNGGRRLDR